jgi:competence CoiA-like predicted nuclease
VTLKLFYDGFAPAWLFGQNDRIQSELSQNSSNVVQWSMVAPMHDKHIPTVRINVCSLVG